MPAANVLDGSCISIIKGWMRTCIERHSTCRASGPPSLPTRLLDAGDTSTDTSVVRLIASKSLPLSTTSYIALSYCWGTGAQLTTTLATLSTRQEGIPIDTMPATHRDLVALARQLGVRYLWIDALCIIQDGALDWETEAASMFSVYRHAQLTVVAGAGDSCHSGFLSRATASPSAIVPFRSKREGVEVVVSAHTSCPA
ncbi:heterokaryon incompatibility protein-domain-containing protein [Podospora didyma]|uniref:Heterokaryon incompatibility protein-domain-containing protein n=1 Tax=Podospora didyma TaxID=330526 RepID=A0AAE0NBP1_9PEZI|nr:heterokaryon incompatibility protein-domain-containing protein [Podospora didyma]